MSLTPAQLSQYQALLAAAQSSPTPHLSFKAGLVELKDGTASPDKRRGTVRLLTTDQLLHLQWLTRPGDSVELDLVVFAGSATWSAVEECKDGRVYSLKYKDSSKKQLFWMQEPTADKDGEISERINQLISSPPDEQSQLPLGAGAGAGGAGGTLAGIPPPTAQLNPPTAIQPPSAATHSAQPSNEQSQNQLQRLLQALATAAASASSSANNNQPAAAAANSNNNNSVATAALTRSLVGAVAQLNRSGHAGGNREPQLPPHSLLDVLQPDRLITVLGEDDIKQLVLLLPGENDVGGTGNITTTTTAAAAATHTDSTGPSTNSASTATPTATSLSASVSRHMRSAQFQQTVGRMQSLLYSENYGSLLGSLGLDPSAGGFGVEGLVAAIERQVRAANSAATAQQQHTHTQPQQPQ